MDTRLIFRDHPRPFERWGDADGTASMPNGHGVFRLIGGAAREIRWHNTSGLDGYPETGTEVVRSWPSRKASSEVVGDRTANRHG